MKNKEQEQFAYKVGCVVAGGIIMLAVMLGFIALANAVVGYSVSDRQAECNSLGGVWASESGQCYYAGKSTSIDQLKQRTGVK